MMVAPRVLVGLMAPRVALMEGPLSRLRGVFGVARAGRPEAGFSLVVTEGSIGTGFWVLAHLAGIVEGDPVGLVGGDLPRRVVVVLPPLREVVGGGYP